MTLLLVLLTLPAESFTPRGFLAKRQCLRDAAFDDLAREIAKGLPPAYDWREHAELPPARNQWRSDAGGKVKCGSCWAFANVAVLEATLAIFHPQESTPHLSEQELVDCVPYSDCGGGNSCLALEYLKRNGVAEQSAVPYAGKNGACDGAREPRAKVSRWAVIGTRGVEPTEEQMKAAILRYGPVIATVYAGTKPFSRYRGGVFGTDPKVCKPPLRPFRGTKKTDHVVSLVGWGQERGKTYWILRNSYGARWGEEGYMRILSGCAAIGHSAIYVVPEPVP